MVTLALIFSTCIYTIRAFQIITSEFNITTGHNFQNTVIIAKQGQMRSAIQCSAFCQRTKICVATIYTQSSGLCELHATDESQIIISEGIDGHKVLGILKAESKQSKNWTALGAVDCYHTTSLEYRGTASHTVSGKTCQYWNTDTPHTVHYMPVDTTAHDTNYCRESTHYEGAPGCHTTDPNLSWEYCFIPKCDACGLDTRLPVAPPGTTSSFQFGKFIGILFTCDSLVAGQSVDHCPVSQCGNDDQWSGYLVSCTGEDCYSDSSLYQGKVTCTVAGIPCMVWNDAGGAKPSVNDIYTNYCRDPDGTGKPWCYTTDSNVRWDFCPVPLC